MKLKRLFAVALLPLAAAAQPVNPAGSLDSGTYDVYFQEISRQGELTGSSMVFTAIVSDHVYKRGEQVILNGNIALQTFGKGELAFTAKLGTKSLLREADVRQSPNHFYVAGGGYSTAGKAKFGDSDVEGYKLLVAGFDRDTTKLLDSILSTGTFRIGFNRKDGGMDLNATIDTTVSLRRDQSGGARRIVNKATPEDFGRCVGRLASDLANRLSGKNR